MMKFKVEAYSNQAFQLGEGPHWNPRDKKLYFVDLPGSGVYTIDANKQLQTILKEDTSYFTAVFPIESDQDNVAVSIDTSLYLVNVHTGAKKLVANLGVDGVRFNDGKCDPRGRLFLGTMGFETAPGVLEAEKGALYVLSNETKKFMEVFPKVTLSNGLAWSPDETKFYFVDSVPRKVYIFDYDVSTGAISNPTTLVDMASDAFFTKEELPDGMTIDAQGNLWVAMFRGSRVVNIDGKTGKALGAIDLPASLITSVAFGGDKLNEMYVTSSLAFLEAASKPKEPLAGYVFKVTSSDPSFRGFKPQFDLKL